MKTVLERKYLSYARNGEHFQLFQALRKVLPQEMAEELKGFLAGIQQCVGAGE